MNDTRLNLDIFENADDDIAREIAAYCSASDSEKERMFAMSRKIYKERTNESINTDTIEVSGVERYKKPVWNKIMSMAAALILITGIGTGGAFILLNDKMRTGPETVATDIAAEEKIYPFDDLSNCRVQIKHTDGLIDLSEELSSDLKKAFTEGKWKPLPEDTEPDPAFLKGYQVVLTKGDSPMFFSLYKENHIICDCGASHTKWEVSEEITDVIFRACSYASAEADKNKAEEAARIAEEKFAESEKEDELIEVPNIEFMHKDLAVEQLLEREFKVNVIFKESNGIQPYYVISTSPQAGEKVNKGATINVYVSTESFETLTMNDYKGINYKEAEQLAEYKSLNADIEYVNSTEAKDIVVDQEPKPGENIESYSTIILYVSNGISPE